MDHSERNASATSLSSKKKKSNDNDRSCLSKISLKIVHLVEKLCGKWGELVAKNPILAIVCTFAIVGVFGSGLMYITLIFKPYDLWVPQKSEFYEVTQWKDEYFPSKNRNQQALWESENILRATIIREMWRLHIEIMALEVQVGNETFTWKDLCTQIPSDLNEETKNLSIALDMEEYVCVEGSLLELWDHDPVLISELTDEDVVRAVNSVEKSRYYGTPKNISQILGGVTRDANGRIEGAKVTVQVWKTKVNYDMIAKGQFEVDVGSGDKVDSAGMAWERKLVHLIDEWKQIGFSINVNADHTLGDILFYSLTGDAVWILIGWVVLLGYVIFTLGLPSNRDQRIIPALMGLVGIMLSVISSYGICAMMGIPYGTLTNVLPVLLVAIGVDDMYVIATTWDSIDHRKITGGLVERAQLTMQRAGMAITVTSLTNVLAFSAGGFTTDLPGLRYFCIYSCMGIVMVYFIQETLFVAVLVLNQRWIDSKKSSKSLKTDFKGDTLVSSYLNSQFLVRLYSKYLIVPFVKGSVIALTSAAFIFSCYTLTNISREFDTFWLVPESSTLHKFVNTLDESFPQRSETGFVFFRGVDLPDDLDQLKELASKLERLTGIYEVNAWFLNFDVDKIRSEYPWILNLPEGEQCKILIDKLGPIFRDHFTDPYDDEDASDHDEGNSTARPCSTFKLEYFYIPPPTHVAKQDAMRAVRQLVAETNVSGYKAVWSQKFSQWETDRIILRELLQSIGIVLLAVGLISVVLLASIRSALLVLTCVVGTLVNVAAFVHLWGLTINTVTGIAFVLAIGICVDYATHIAHDFLVTRGTRDERVTAALRHMGVAVIHGGCSTFITFVILYFSDSYIYVSYFKILTSVSVSGLYHALVFLPVMLSLVGSPSHGGEADDRVHPADVEALLQCSSTKAFISRSDYNLSRPYDLSESKPPRRRPTHRKSRSLPSYSFFLSSAPYQAMIVVNGPAEGTKTSCSGGGTFLRRSSKS